MRRALASAGPLIDRHPDWSLTRVTQEAMARPNLDLRRGPDLDHFNWAWRRTGRRGMQFDVMIWGLLHLVSHKRGHATIHPRRGWTLIDYAISMGIVEWDLS